MIASVDQVGGLLGLFMGFSFVSGVEIFYHLFKIVSARIITCNEIS
jgi:hypothetical protein